MPGTEVRPQSHVDTPEWQRFEARMLARRAERRAHQARVRRARLAKMAGVVALFTVAATLGFGGTWIIRQPIAFTAAPPTAPPGIALRINDGVPPLAAAVDSIPNLETPKTPEPEDGMVADLGTLGAPAQPFDDLPVATAASPRPAPAAESNTTANVVRNGVNERAVPIKGTMRTPSASAQVAAAVEPPTAPVTIVPGTRNAETPQATPPRLPDRSRNELSAGVATPDPRVEPAANGTTGGAAPVPGLASRPEAPPASTAAPANVPRPAIDQRAQIRNILERYRLAYERLDASAAGAVWPGVDRRALARAFGSLQSQQIDFRECRILTAPAAAQATCTGRARAVPKIGSGGVSEADRTWDFLLVQKDDEWQIAKATVR